MKNAYTGVSTRATAQTEAILGEAQIRNSAGGFVYELDQWKALERFLVLGTEGGTYYVSEQKLTKDAAANVLKCIEADGKRVVDTVVAISDAGRAPKNDPAIFVLALASAAKNVDTRAYALAALPKVCRIGTHLFHFNQYVEQFRGRGKTLNRAVKDWYQSKSIDDLAYGMVKYQQRDGWSHRDLLRLVRPKARSEQENILYKWAVKGLDGLDANDIQNLPKVIAAHEALKAVNGMTDVPRFIRDHNLSREMLPTELLTRADVWDALLDRMPLGAMVRNLGNMSKVGLLKPLSDASRIVCERLSDPAAIRKARLHPVALLIAQKIYDQGKGLKGKGEWTAVPAVVDALNDAFYLAFNAIEPTGKRFLIGVDVSGSMGSPCGSLPISCAEGAAAMSLAIAATEKEHYIHGFSGGARYFDQAKHQPVDGFVDLGITPRMRLNDALKRTTDSNFGSTDCAIPMLWALRNNVKVDCFIVITDNETWQGNMHASQALSLYREKTGIAAKEVVVGMTATNFTIADPKDPLTIDVVGFDANVPAVVQDFAR